MNTITRFFLIILTLLSNYDASRITLVQRQACRFMTDTKEVLCQCREEDSKAYLGVRMQGFVMKAGEEVLIKSFIQFVLSFLCRSSLLWWNPVLTSF